MKKLTIVLLLAFSTVSVALGKSDQEKFSKNNEIICDGTDKAWIKEKTTYNKDHLLFKYVVSLFGRATQCSGEIDSIFDGQKFGKITYKFENKAILKFETMPPETSKSTLEVLNGFNNEKEAIEKIQEAVKKAGLKITLDKPEIEKSGLIETKTFWDPDGGTNGRLFLVYDNKKLVSVGYGMAL